MNFGIACNVSDGTPAVRKGSLCWVCRSRTNNVRVMVRSRGGRWITTHFALWKLENFRAKWLPPVSSIWRNELDYPSREAAEADALRIDASARDERARRNVRDIERMAGFMDEHGRRNGCQHER